MWQSVIETPTYLADARAIGLADEEREGIVLHLAARPDAGTPIPGTGGARKVRFAGRGKGKSGDYRVITFFSGADIPVFLLAVLHKGERADLSAKEKQELRRELTSLVDEYREGVKSRVEARKQVDQGRQGSPPDRTRGS